LHMVAGEGEDSYAKNSRLQVRTLFLFYYLVLSEELAKNSHILM